MLIVISGSLFSACQFAYKDAKNKNAFSPYILASRFATYTPFFNLNYFALAAKEHQRLLSIANTVPYFQLSVRDTGIDTYVLIVGGVCTCRQYVFVWIYTLYDTASRSTKKTDQTV